MYEKKPDKKLTGTENALFGHCKTSAALMKQLMDADRTHYQTAIVLEGFRQVLTAIGLAGLHIGGKIDTLSFETKKTNLFLESQNNRTKYLDE